MSRNCEYASYLKGWENKNEDMTLHISLQLVTETQFHVGPQTAHYTETIETVSTNVKIKIS